MSRPRFHRLRGGLWVTAAMLWVLGAAAGEALGQAGKPDGPQPRYVAPGRDSGPPSDAVVLFDGKDFSQWTTRDGRPLAWRLEGGAMVSAASHAKGEKSGAGDLLSKARFGSAQIHVEFATPNMPQAKGQARGNSGVYLQGRYEIQVLDSYQNPTYANGSSGALYGRYAPLVNASRPPEEWQTYDIIFHAPTCTPEGKPAEPGSLTLLYNGVLVQDHVPVVPRQKCDPEPGPLLLQDHYHPDAKDTPIKFRNIWYRPLGDAGGAPPASVQ